MSDDPLEREIWARLRRNVLAAICLGTTAIAASVWAGVHYWLNDIIKSAVAEGLNDATDPHLRPAMLNFLNREYSAKTPKLFQDMDKFATNDQLDKAVEKKISSLIGISVGEHAELSPENWQVNFPIVIPHDGQAWLLYKVVSPDPDDAIIKHIGITINGEDASPLESFKRNSVNTVKIESVPLDKWISEHKETKVAAISGSDNQTRIRIAGTEKSAVENNIFQLGIYLPNEEKNKLQQYLTQSQKSGIHLIAKNVTIYFTVFAVNALNVEMLGESENAQRETK